MAVIMEIESFARGAYLGSDYRGNWKHLECCRKGAGLNHTTNPPNLECSSLGMEGHPYESFRLIRKHHIL
jgi:hypothetical protein